MNRFDYVLPFFHVAPENNQKDEKKEKFDNLKQELDIDFHKITKEELYLRFKTDPENVYKRIHLQVK